MERPLSVDSISVWNVAAPWTGAGERPIGGASFELQGANP